MVTKVDRACQTRPAASRSLKWEGQGLEPSEAELHRE